MALALTRTEGEAILLSVDGREIRVGVAHVDGAQVRLAITAPDDVALWREETVGR